MRPAKVTPILRKKLGKLGMNLALGHGHAIAEEDVLDVEEIDDAEEDSEEAREIDRLCMLNLLEPYAFNKIGLTGGPSHSYLSWKRRRAVLLKVLGIVKGDDVNLDDLDDVDFSDLAERGSPPDDKPADDESASALLSEAKKARTMAARPREKWVPYYAKRGPRKGLMIGWQRRGVILYQLKDPNRQAAQAAPKPAKRKRAVPKPKAKPGKAKPAKRKRAVPKAKRAGRRDRR